MRIMLISPPFYRLTSPKGHHNSVPLGLSCIGASLRQQGHTVALYCTDYLPNNEYPSQSEIFSNLDYYKRSHIEHPVWGEVKEAITDFSPHVVGISMMTPTWRSAQRVAMIAKQVDRDTLVVAGGAHVTLTGIHEVLQLPWFGAAVMGEADNILINEIGVRLSSTDPPNLDTLPLPMRDNLINSTTHVDLGNIATSRGCSHACTYCASPQLWHRKVRYRSIDNVIEEVELLRNMRVSPVRFVDDAFNLNIERTTELLKRMPTVEWVCEARIDRLTPELLKLMREKGCQRIKCGIESGSDRILKAIRKGITVEQIRKGVELIHGAQIPLTAYIMCGFPSETNADIEQTLELAKWMEADYYSVSVFTPYFGTQAYKELEEQGKLPKVDHWEYFFHQSNVMVSNDSISPENIKRLLALNDNGKERV